MNGALRATLAALTAWVLLHGAAAAGDHPPCAVPRALLDLGFPLPRTAARVAAREPLTIVAVGSSSTAGAGASAPQFAYPARLEAELAARLPFTKVRVINRGVNGEQAREMIARFERDVLGEQPDLVIWQVGANTVLRRTPLDGYPLLLAEGVTRLRKSDADVIIMDVQYAPRILGIPQHVDVEQIMESFSHNQRVPLFRRFAIMRHWATAWPPEAGPMLSADGLHLNDLSYACVARLLADGIVDALRRHR